jgi:hypothetical protein
LRRVIDEELARLPDKYRSAVVLCDLEGVSRADAAVRLKIPEGTLSSRLAYARKILAGRLSRRGISSTAGAVAVALAREARGGSVPRALVLHTAQAAARVASGGVVPPDLVSPIVFSITDGVMKTMLANRLRLTLGAALACGLLGLGAFGLAQVPAQNAVPPEPEVVRYVPMPADPFAANFLNQQPKPEKVAAKGIEDDDVPLPAMPSQAVVRVEEGKLIVRQRGFHYQPVAQVVGERAVTSYQMKSGVTARTFDPADVQVFDVKGNRLQNKAWKDKLKNDVHALISNDGKLPNPRELALFKEDTLIIVVPGSGPTAYWGVTDNIPAPSATPALPPRPSTPVPPSVTLPSNRSTPAVPARPRTPPPQPPTDPPAQELPPPPTEPIRN